MLEYYKIVKRVLDVKTDETICVIETFPLITKNVPSDKSVFIKISRAKRERKRAFFRAKTKAKFLRQNFFLLSAKNRTKTRTKLCFMKKKHFFRKNFSQNCENHPIFGVRNAAY